MPLRRSVAASSPSRPDELDWDGRDPPRHRGARQPVARRARPASRPICASPAPRPWRRAFSAGSRPGRTGSSSRPNAIGEEGALKRYRQRLQAALRLGKGLSMAIDYQERIPNNVDLAGNRTLAARARTLAAALPRLVARDGADAISSAPMSICAPRPRSMPQGWASFGTVKMPDYRWGIFLADAVARPPHRLRRRDRQAGWQQVPGEHRSTLRRLIVTQGDTEPASVEQQRLLGHTCPSLYDLRNLFQVNVEEGRHLWAMVYLLHAYFGRDGREEAEELLARHSGDAGQAAHPRHLQRADRGLAVVSSCSPISPTATASSS